MGAKAQEEAQKHASAQTKEDNGSVAAEEESVAPECDYKARREVEEKVKHEIEEQVRREVQEKMNSEPEKPNYPQANADNAGAIQRAEDEKMRREVEQWARRKIEQKALAAKAQEEAQKHASAQTKEDNGNVAAETTQSKGCTGIKREMNQLKDHLEKTHREAHDEAAYEAEGARQQTEENVAPESDHKTRREVEEKVKHEIEEQVRREVHEKVKRELEGEIWREAEK